MPNPLLFSCLRVKEKPIYWLSFLPITVYTEQMDAFDYLILIISILMPISNTGHIFRMIKEKSSRGQSLSTIVFLGSCSAVWLAYSFRLDNIPLIVGNFLWIIVYIFYFITIIRYRDGKLLE
jgi:uncharacterized protein with PQ loop repeat